MKLIVILPITILSPSRRDETRGNPREYQDVLWRLETACTCRYCCIRDAPHWRDPQKTKYSATRSVARNRAMRSCEGNRSIARLPARLTFLTVRHSIALPRIHPRAPDRPLARLSLTLSKELYTFIVCDGVSPRLLREG